MRQIKIYDTTFHVILVLIDMTKESAVCRMYRVNEQENYEKPLTSVLSTISRNLQFGKLTDRGSLKICENNGDSWKALSPRRSTKTAV